MLCPQIISNNLNFWFINTSSMYFTGVWVLSSASRSCNEHQHLFATEKTNLGTHMTITHFAIIVLPKMVPECMILCPADGRGKFSVDQYKSIFSWKENVKEQWIDHKVSLNRRIIIGNSVSDRKYLKEWRKEDEFLGQSIWMKFARMGILLTRHIHQARVKSE